MDAGYSGRPQHAKLGIKPGLRVALDRPPDGWALSDLPDGVTMVDPPGDATPDAPTGGATPSDAPQPADIIVGFFTSADSLAARLPDLARAIYPGGALWVAWPRRAAGHTSDITDSVVRDVALPLGVVDVKVAAIDEDWSGLRLVWRKALR